MCTLLGLLAELVQVLTYHCGGTPHLLKKSAQLSLTKVSCSGTYLFLDAPIEATVSYVKDCAVKARSSLIGATRIRDYVAGAIDKFQPEGAGIHTDSVINAQFCYAIHAFVLCMQRSENKCIVVKSDSNCAGPALEGNLEVSVTTVPRLHNVRVKHFKDNKAVKNAILASACIVPPPVHLPGHGWAMDGAFSDFQILKVSVTQWAFL